MVKTCIIGSTETITETIKHAINVNPIFRDEYYVPAETDAETRDALIAESLLIQTDNLCVSGIARRLPVMKDNVRKAVGLNQDWVCGFCATSRPETCWFGAE